MTDKTNVITVSEQDLAWINTNVPGKSKRERLVNILSFYKSQKEPRPANPLSTGGKPL